MEHTPPQVPDGLTPLQQLALERIRFFEKELEEKYGLRVRCGMELEFFVTDKEGKPLEGALNVEQALEYLRNEQGMPEIERFYPEGVHSRSRDGQAKAIEYEVAVGKAPAQDQAVSPTELVASRIHALKAHALHAMLNSTTCLNTPKILHHTALLADFSTTKERTNESGHPYRETAGMQVSVSLENKQGVNVFSTCPALMFNCAEHLKQVQEAGLLAMAPHGGASLERFRHHTATKGFGVRWKVQPVNSRNPSTLYNSVFLRYQGDIEDIMNNLEIFRMRSEEILAHGGTEADARVPYNEDKDRAYYLERATRRDGGASLRIENRIPGTDADPYVSAAITLAALYQAVKRTVKERPENTEGLELLDDERGLYVQPYTRNVPAQAIPTNSEHMLSIYRRSPWLPQLLSPALYSQIIQDYGPQR